MAKRLDRRRQRTIPAQVTRLRRLQARGLTRSQRLALAQRVPLLLMQGYQTQARNLFLQIREAILSSLPEAYRLDAITGELVKQIGLIKMRVGRVVSDFEGTIKRRGRQIETFAVNETRRVFGIQLDRSFDRARNEFIERNVQLISSIAQSELDRVSRLVERSNQAGERVEDIAREIRNVFDVSESRAALIARDQILKLNSQITRETHERLGITRYIWCTSQDDRVRETHESVDGQVFSYADPPEWGNPGEDYQCRCVALPLADELDDDLIAQIY